jgi:hypothetical protein
MVAVGGHVGDTLLARYRHDFERVTPDDDPLVAALGLVRKHCRSRLNQAWYELAVAARTNTALKKALVPITARYYSNIERLARELLPELAATLGQSFPVVVDTVVSIFDGEVIHRFVMDNPAVEDARLDVLTLLLRQGLPGLARAL